MMTRFMAWLGFTSITAPMPGRSGRTIWEEMVDEFGKPPVGHWPVAEVMPDWEAA